ncbi:MULTISPECIES: patatin-like phospholipase family protein [Chryseobacterium]|uniref:Putative NTE family protein n=1 Tax=Chryseobacterium salivictor TaxID=2547600 RepID=A0A4P6ZE90_9FLAO|nr:MULTISPECIES: patatin-like phospholipase family protein [Chryseobacterium]MDQ0475905.1 NTE family protein [Chryseobacterium sp. MDT2-18]QBO57759.1 putative NTE family protein [Chryseobacterium salivictor]
MKKCSICFLFLLLAITLNAQIKEGFTIPKHPKIGLSLSGGGAKGFAHIGVLKVLDSLGVKVDYISGTSMGAIVGGLYASGYTGKEIEKIVMDTDFYSILANEKTRQETTFFNKSVDNYILTVPIKNGKINVLPKAISTGQKNIYLLKELFKNVSTITDFSKLPIPFMCVATNLESGDMKLFESGDLVSAIMASSAFPSLMDPVKIGDSLYIDGAMTINYPSQPLKEKGIDIVIGVDLSQGLASRKDLQSAISILNQVIDFGIQKETKIQYNYTDINIHPNLEGMGATSYDAKKAILDSGYVEAQKYMQTLSLLPKKDQKLLRAPMSTVYSNVYKIDSLILFNGYIFKENYVLGKMNLKVPSLQTYGGINKMIDKLYATNNYRLINYDIVEQDNKNFLKLNVTEDDTRFFLRFGLHYDEIFKTGLMLNATAKRLLFRNSTVSLDVVVGDRPRYYFNYFIDNGYIPGLGVYASGISMDLNDETGNVYDKWNWFRNEIFLQSIWRDKYAVGAGLSNDYFESKPFGSSTFTASENYINAYAFIKSDTQDDRNFPTKGFLLNVEGKVLDILHKYDDGKTLQAKITTQLNFPINSWLTYRLGLVGGFTIGDNLSPYYNYRLGGIFEQNLGNLVSFQGYQFGEVIGRNILSSSNTLQFRVAKSYFIDTNISFANLFDDHKVDNILHISESSAGLTAGYRSPFGQIKINYSQPLKNKNGILSIILGHWF